jgi:hypothetical protein
LPMMIHSLTQWPIRTSVSSRIQSMVRWLWQLVSSWPVSVDAVVRLSLSVGLWLFEFCIRHRCCDVILATMCAVRSYLQWTVVAEVGDCHVPGSCKQYADVLWGLVSSLFFWNTTDHLWLLTVPSQHFSALATSVLSHSEYNNVSSLGSPHWAIPVV